MICQLPLLCDISLFQNHTFKWPQTRLSGNFKVIRKTRCLNLQVFVEVSNLRGMCFFNYALTPFFFRAGIYCTKNRSSQCTATNPQECAMIGERTIGRYGKADCDSAWLVRLFLAHISILITSTVISWASILKMFRDILTYLLHFLELQIVPTTQPLSNLAHKCQGLAVNQNHLQFIS